MRILPWSWTVGVLALLTLSRTAQAQGDAIKAEPLKEPPPTALAPAVRGVLAPEGIRVLDADGKPYADIWIRKAVPTQAKYEGPKGAVLIPVLAAGELVGAIRYHRDGQDYRDQVIAPGVYTLRYGLQPVNGDHLGVSAYRDFLLVIEAAKDFSPGPLDQKKVETRSAEAAGSNHPAVLMLVAAPSGKNSLDVSHDAEKNLWGVILGIPLSVEGATPDRLLPLQVILVGSAPA